MTRLIRLTRTIRLIRLARLIRPRAVALLAVAGLACAQLAVAAEPAFARTLEWPPHTANSGICEDGGDPWNPGACRFRATFKKAPSNGLTFYVTTKSGSAQAGKDFVALQHSPVQVPPGAKEVSFTVVIVSDGQCEPDEKFSVKLSTNDPQDAEVEAEATVTDAAC